MLESEPRGARWSRRSALSALGAWTLSPSIGRAAEPVPAAALSCVVTPAETEGPFFVDERLDRSDLTLGAKRSAVAEGVPLSLRIGVYDAPGSACTPLAGAQVDVWHADASGAYSDVQALRTAGETFLRGYQITDRGGLVAFKTIYPGWYSGRAIHIHFKVRTASSSGTSAYTFTSQIFMPESINDAVLAKPPYDRRGPRDTTNGRDSIYDRSLLLALRPADKGYAGTFTVGLRTG
jgi:protocatechuate 3,4-dioxygenase beta subunit